MGRKSSVKLISIIATGLLTLFLIITPIVISAAVVATPVVVIHDFFVGLGEFIFGSGESNEAVEIMRKYFELAETKQQLKELYQPLIDEEKENGFDIPMNWLVIPNLLAGIEEVDETMIRTQIKCMKDGEELRDLEGYINELRKQEPWNEGFGGISITTIVGYINEFASYMGQEESLDIGGLKDKDFLYPLKEKARVTSEWGPREIEIDPSGFHRGIDLAYSDNSTTCGVPIYATQGGTVVETDKTANGQNYLIGAYGGKVRYDNVDVWYVHMRDPFPYEAGAVIKKGDFVGYIGESGLAQGCHLHLEIWVSEVNVNPRNFIEF